MEFCNSKINAFLKNRQHICSLAYLFQHPADLNSFDLKSEIELYYLQRQLDRDLIEIGLNRTPDGVLVIILRLWAIKVVSALVGTAGDPEGSVELRESGLYAHSCQGDGLCGRAGLDG